jgi:hypothetical protein
MPQDIKLHLTEYGREAPKHATAIFTRDINFDTRRVLAGILPDVSDTEFEKNYEELVNFVEWAKVEKAIVYCWV